MKTNLLNSLATHGRQSYVLLAAIWSMLVIGSLAWNIHNEKQSTLRTATAAARANISKDMSFRKWATSHGGVYVAPTEHTPPNPHLKVPDRDVVTTSGKALTLMNPAYMLRQMQTDFPGDFGTQSRIASLDPINPKNAADAWQAKALRSFEQGAKELLEIQQLDGQPYLRMMLPFIAEPGCLKCHDYQGYKLGDIRGGISSAIHMGPFLAQEHELISGMALSHGAIWLIGLAGLGFSHRSDRRQADERERTANKLRASEHSLSEAQRIAHIGSWDFDIVRNTLAWSDEIYRIFEIDPEKFGASYDAFLDAIHPDDRTLVDKAYNESVKNRTPYDIEHRLLMRDGRVKYVNEVGETYYGEDGKPLRSFGIVHDITARKLAEDELREKEERLALATVNNGVGIWDWNLQTQEMIWDDSMYALYHIRREDFIGTEEAWRAALYPDDLARGDQEVEDAISGKKPFETEFRVLWPNGEIRYIKAVAKVFRDSRGTPLRMLGINMDVSDHRKAETELRELNNDFITLLENTSDFIYFKDRDSRFRFCSQTLADITGHRNWRDMIGKHDLEVFPEDAARIYYEEELPIFREGKALLSKIDPYYDEHGKRGWVSTNKWPVFGDDKKTVVGIFGISRDITDLKEAESRINELNRDLEQRVAVRTAELEVTNKELEAFSYSVSHDLRTPLRAIDGFSRILLEDYESKLDDEGKRLLSVVRDNASRMSRLIDDILHFSRTGRSEMFLSEIDMEGMARTVIDELKPLFAGRKLQINLGRLPGAQGDRAMMHQVFENLLTNAIKFTGKNETAHIDIGGKTEEGKIVYHVKDDGVGFDMQYAEKLFGVFQRLHRVEEFEGTGIGLAIAKRIIARHGGTIWAEGEVGKGATFYFSIPDKSA